jgi:hypothetical protein
MSNGNTCIFCNNALDSSDEHCISDSLNGRLTGEFADIDHLIPAQTDHRFRGKLTT